MINIEYIEKQAKSKNVNLTFLDSPMLKINNKWYEVSTWLFIDDMFKENSEVYLMKNNPYRGFVI